MNKPPAPGKSTDSRKDQNPGYAEEEAGTKDEAQQPAPKPAKNFENSEGGVGDKKPESGA